MKKRRTIMIIFFFIGLLIYIYPSIRDFYNYKFQRKVITKYEDVLLQYKKEEYLKELMRAKEYNEKLSNLSNQYFEYDKLENYNEILNIDNNGMIGYLTIDKIEVELPIYHGVGEEVLTTAVGHLEGSSIPIGGINTHSVLLSHRGLSSAKLFTELDKLKIKDVFKIIVLGKTITYQVDQIKVVEPTDTSYLEIIENEDYVTLMTCTPYGINSHRLLVRGKRVN